ncbi:MAG: replicative DNA helicase [Chitinivibrionales bacterium]|nr:replicative DNA helicase [Chitinivibrionales bacterium]
MPKVNGQKEKRSPFTQRIPPQAPDVERAVLGSMLIDASNVATAMEILDENCFYVTAHKRIYECMVSMFDKDVPLDVLTLSEELRKRGWLESVGAEPYLSELVESIATSANIEHHAKILLEKSTLRQLISIAAEITTESFDSERVAQEILDNAEQKVFGISEARVKGQFESMHDLLQITFRDIEQYAQEGGVQGVRSGFTKLDEMMAGFQAGDLIIVAGRPSMGKTAFCLSLALNASVRASKPVGVAIFSLEMSKSQIVQRMLCSEAKVNMHALRSGHLPKRDYPKLSMAAGPLSQARIFIDDTPGITILELRAKARRLKAQHNVGLIIIDYLQLMGSAVSAENRQQEISQISRALKGVAKELSVPVIALSQLSRAVEQRGGDHRPQLSDLRESGAIEQDADVVMFIFRESVYNKELDDHRKGVAEIILRKQRNGPVGTAEVAFVEDFASFENLAEMQVEDSGF